MEFTPLFSDFIHVHVYVYRHTHAYVHHTHSHTHAHTQAHSQSCRNRVQRARKIVGLLSYKCFVRTFLRVTAVRVFKNSRLQILFLHAFMEIFEEYDEKF